MGQERIDRILLKKGWVTEDQLKGAVQKQETEAKRGRRLLLGEILVEMGLLKPEQVREVLALQGMVPMRCPGCRKMFNVKRPAPGNRMVCRTCRTPLVAPESALDLHVEETHGGLQHEPVGKDIDPALADLIPGYTIERHLGSGGMGEVYLARHKALDRAVALKLLPPELSRDHAFITRFLNEARLAARLDHGHIVRALDAGESKGRHYFVMEYVEGETLASLIRREGPLSEKRSLGIVRQVVLGLQHAHRNNLIHRDIKPSNIMLGVDGTVKILDFGLARDLSSDVVQTQAGFVRSSPAYASPEQCQAQDLDHRSDMYSLGITLFEMLTGRRPFSAEVSSALFVQHVNQAPPAPRDLNPALSPEASQFVLRLLRKKPQGRFASYDELLEGVDSVEKHASPKPKTVRATAAPAARPKWVLPLAIGGVALLVLVLVIAAGSGRGAGNAGRPSESTSKAADPAEAQFQVLLRQMRAQEDRSMGDPAQLTSLREKWKELAERYRGTSLYSLACASLEDFEGRVNREAEKASDACFLEAHSRVKEGRLSEAILALRKFPPGFGGTKAATLVAGRIIEIERQMDRKLREGEDRVSNLMASGDYSEAGKAIEELRGQLTAPTGAGREVLPQRHAQAIDALSRNLEERRASVTGRKEESPAAAPVEAPAPASGVPRVLKPVAVDPKVLKPGLAAELYSGRDFNKLGAKRIDPRVVFEGGLAPAWPAGPSDNYSIRWTGYLLVPEAGIWMFEVYVDDGAVLCLDENRILRDWRSEGYRRLSSAVRLEKGYHKISLEYVQFGGPSWIGLYWRREDGPAVAIGPDHLFHDPGAPAEPFQSRIFPEVPSERLWNAIDLMKIVAADFKGLKPGLIAEFFSGRHFQRMILRRVDPHVNWEWKGGAAFQGGPEDEFSSRWTGYLNIPRTGDYCLEVGADDGCALFVDGKRCLDHWRVQAAHRHRALCTLEKGLHRIALEHYEGGGHSGIVFFIREGNGPSVPVPQEYFFHDPSQFKPFSVPAPVASAPLLPERPDPRPEERKVPEIARPRSSGKSPEPAPAEQKKAEKLIRDLYKEEYARKSPAEVKSLAARLLESGLKTQEDEAARFVLLREARDLALHAGSTEAALMAIDAIGKFFETNTASMRLSVLQSLAKSAVDAEDCVLLAGEALKQGEWFVGNDDYSSAEKALGVAEAAARKSKDLTLLSRVQSMVVETQAVRREYERVKSSIKSLEENPEDPAANLCVGRFYCVFKGEWSRGLPYLSKGADAGLKAAAEKDLAGAPGADALAAIGDTWWTLGEKQKGASKNHVQERALHWYRQAWKGLAGIAKEKVRARFKAALFRPGLPPSKKAGEPPSKWRAGGEKDRIQIEEGGAHGGRCSIRLQGGQGDGGSFAQGVKVTPGRKYVFSAWILTDRTDNSDPFVVILWHGAGSVLGGPRVPLDQPWWTLVQGTYECGEDTGSIEIIVRSTKDQAGTVWVDDLSLKGVDDGIELLDNGSIER
jgi:hypothetical protein